MTSGGDEPVPSAGAAGASHQRGIQAAILAYTVWGLLTFYWKRLADFDPFELIGWRMIFAAVVMAGLVTVRGTWPVLRASLADSSVRWRLVVAAVLLTVNWSSYVWTVANDRVLESALGYFMAPLGTMALGVTVLHERPTRIQRVAIACAAIAVVVLAVSYGRPPWAALLIACSWSTYGLVKRQVPLSGTESLAGETFVMVVPALVVVGLYWPGDGSVPAMAGGADWLFVVGTGVVTAVPLVLFGLAARSVPFTILGALQYLVPTINFVIGWLWYDEELPASRVIGFSLVWLALALITFDRVRAGRAARVPALA